MHLNLRQRIVFLNTFLPRRCSIAVSTLDLLHHKHQASEKILADGRGVPVPFGDAQQMAGVINKLLSDELLMDRIMQRVYHYGRAMTWQKASQAYRNILGARRPLLHTFVRPRLSMQTSIKGGGDPTLANVPEKIHSRKATCL
jgi:hypothetical protein